MAKITFSARKDPLLPPRSATIESRANEDPSAVGAGSDADAGGAAATESPAHTAADASHGAREPQGATEEPVGVIAIPTAPSSRTTREPQPSDTASGARDAERAARAQRGRSGARRVQTSISLPPASWDALDEVASSAGVSVGELLTAILAAAIPETPAAALGAVEELLVSSAPDDGPHEERNYRLPLELRTQLDALTKALGPRGQRSLLIRALIAAQGPQTGEQARALVTARRIETMRSALHAAA